MLPRHKEIRGHFTCAVSMASSVAPCSIAALSVASGCVEPRGFLTRRLLRLASSSQTSIFQNSLGILETFAAFSFSALGPDQAPWRVLKTSTTGEKEFVDHSLIKDGRNQGPLLFSQKNLPLSTSRPARTPSRLRAAVMR